MPTTPFSPELHLKLKRQLGHNLATLTGLRGRAGFKLRFSPAEGTFVAEDGKFVRTVRNLFADNKDSALNLDMFEHPLLLTFYECRKLEQKMARAADPAPYAARVAAPAQAFLDAAAGLTFLRDRTYAGKADHRAALESVLTKADRLRTAADRLALDQSISAWVPFAIPVALRRVVERSVADRKITGLLGSSLSRGVAATEIACAAGDLIYGYYKAGEGGATAHAPVVDPGAFLNRVSGVARGRGATVIDQNSGLTIAEMVRTGRQHKVGFMHFYHPAWGARQTGHGVFATKARVYLHVKSDGSGSAMCAATEAIFAQLPRTFPGVSLGQRFHKFKICSLDMMARYADSIVLWVRDYEDARRLARELLAPLTGLLAPGSVTGVRTVAPGVGISTEPETTFSPAYFSGHRHGQADPRRYSFGTHRCEVIAWGLITAARANDNTLPNLEACLAAVAVQFAGFDLNFYKPYKTAAGV